jgi:hypothetical protein
MRPGFNLMTNVAAPNAVILGLVPRICLRDLRN